MEYMRISENNPFFELSLEGPYSEYAITLQHLKEKCTTLACYDIIISLFMVTYNYSYLLRMLFCLFSMSVINKFDETGVFIYTLYEYTQFGISFGAFLYFALQGGFEWLLILDFILRLYISYYFYLFLETIKFSSYYKKSSS